MATAQNFKYELPALRVLENEHRYLTYLMDGWHTIVLAFERDIYTVDEGPEALQSLRKLIVDFIEPLKNHTEKEEEFLFPMLAKYVGGDQGPVSATEEEHEEIDSYIGHFLHHTLGDMGQLSMAEMKKIVNDAAEAYEVITVHFVKEESILFEMVNNILGIEEQDKLYEQLYTPII